MQGTSNQKRWNETCSRCGLKCHGHGRTWIDTTRVCADCYESLIDDVIFLQDVANDMIAHSLSQRSMTKLLARKQYMVYLFLASAPEDTKRF